MFSFLQTAKKDVSKAVNTVKKDTTKGLNFIGNTAQDVGTTAKTVVTNPGAVIKSAVKEAVVPVKATVNQAKQNFDVLSGPTSTQAERSSIISNQKAAANSDKFKQALKGIDINQASPQGRINAAKLHVQGAPAADINASLKQDIAESNKQTKTGEGVLLDAISSLVGGGVAKDVATGAKTAKDVKNVGEVAKSSAKVAAKAGVTGAQGSAGNQLIEKGKISAGQTTKDAIVSALLGGTTEAGVKVIGKGASVSKALDESGHIGSGISSKELDDLESRGGAIASSQDRAKQALLGTKPKAAVNSVDKPVAQTGAQVANDALPGGTKLPDNVINLLGKTGKDKDTGVKAPVFDAARDPQSVLARHFGKEGSDIAYDAATATKKRTDLQDAARPFIDDAEKKLKATAKTDVGRADVESRINSALEDRANAKTYLKNQKEVDAYEATAKFYDHYQGHIADAGKGTLENYSPRIQRQNAIESADGLDRTVSQAFSKTADAKFLKERTPDASTDGLLEKPVSVMRNYSSAVSKQLAYEDMLGKLPERLQNVNPIYALDQAGKQRGTKYLQKYMQDLLQPDVPTSGKGIGKLVSEQTQNKLIAQTYRSALKFSPKQILVNPTQKFAARSQVSKDAIKLSRKVDKKDLENLQEGLSSGKSALTSDALVGTKESKTDALNEKLSGEVGNVKRAFNLGASQHIVNSAEYKAALKSGLKPKEASKVALQSPHVKDGAIRAGNVVTNVTQFGANIATKPAVLRENGTILGTGVSKKWIQQYQRFQLGMLQLSGNITDPKTARALDIMRRGGP